MHSKHNSIVNMIMDVGAENSYLRSRRKLCNVKSICLVIFTMSLISTTTAIKCYVCGDESELPFLETKSMNINETFIKEKIHNSCDEFDRIPLEEKHKYEMECPDDYVGCMLQVGEEVLRTCSRLSIDDCRTANRVHYCYCNRQLCNGENAESIIEKMGDIDMEENDDDVDNESMDEASGSEEDDEDYNYHTTSHKIDSTETSKQGGGNTHGNNLVILSVSTSPQPTINKAVNFNLNKNLLIFLTFTYVTKFMITVK
ncbi:CLUMA_CG014872, isoform A [Clunio marinus]|uniref:CLUMA_CG014872, isoform A n=1 Tax=Clunio marinus TaxID=568069 RepID=A0A1J1IT18_9DIPT|nr:CLUMA_CG014872, isoform A [Clunio marinus]